MCKIIVLVLFLLFVYVVLLRERKAVQIPILTYFVLVSIVFVSGLSKIATDYHLDDGPVLDGGFQRLNEWVGVFAYLLLVPTVLIVAYVSFKQMRKMSGGHRWFVFLYIGWIVILLAVNFVALFVFTLIFFGFAP